MSALGKQTVSPLMWNSAHSWIAVNLVERARTSYSAPEVEQAIIAVLNLTPEDLARKGANGCPIFVNHLAHILKITTQKGYHARSIKRRDEPYHLTEKGRVFFQKYYSDRHGR
ncbi:hypothetical protein [Rhodopila sp.]|uniref:hypothetical protein n=1 Tax=Rhodopila sp. TaxID=2480087 RepID=UPI003D1516EF